MSNDLTLESSLPNQERILQERASQIIRVADEVSDDEFGKFYSDEYGNFAHAIGRDVYLLLSALQLQPGQKLIDLGSGDGRWVFIAAILGLKGEGYELNPKVHRVAQHVQEILRNERILTEDELTRVSLYNDDLLKADLSQTAAVVYWDGSGAGSDNVERKILSEAKEGTKVVIYGYLGGYKKLKPTEINLPLTRNHAKVFEVPAKQ